MANESRLFAGYRALGFVSNHVPLEVRYHQRHQQNYIITCVGKAFHVYKCSGLGITSVSNVLKEDINCLAVDAKLIYTGSGKTIHAHARGRQICHTYNGHEATITHLLPFHEFLISVDRKSMVKVWNVEKEDIYTEINFNAQSFEITALMHPNTYCDKILFGSKQGTLQLWNIKANRLVCRFKGWKTAITCIVQAPALDVVAIGLADGRIILHNLKFDETLMSFTQDWGPVTVISFRTDGNHAVMVSGSPAGHIALWDLEERKLQSQIRDAHDGGVTGLQCLPSEPLMITSSPDNSLKLWTFDQPDGGARLLSQRSGHSAPPTKVRFHGSNGQNILSAGQDSTLRSFSTVHDRHNKSLGRASYNKKQTKKSGLKADQHMMPPIIDFASESSRQSDWDAIAACHRNEKVVTTWNYVRSTMGAHKLMHERFDAYEHHLTTASCLDISPCGNFCAIGYSSGHVDVFNLQSGLYRWSVGNGKAHNAAIRGVCLDGLNTVTVTAGGDCNIKFWTFKSFKLMETIKADAQISKMVLHRESNMLAVALDNFQVLIIDAETSPRKICRRFSGHSNTVTDMTFSADSKMLLTASMDCSLRTWDLVYGRLVDHFLVDSAITSIALSPTNNFLVTTHVDDLGVYLWCNKSIYEATDVIQTLAESFRPKKLSLPGTSSKNKETAMEDGHDEEEGYEYHNYKSPIQIADELVTLSLLPSSRWKNLLNLDVIKERNKPKEPPKVPKSAPFFLPTIAGLVPKFAPIEEEKEKKDKSLINGSLLPLTEFGTRLLKAQKAEEYVELMSSLKTMGPSALDSELRSLGPDGGGSFELLENFLKVLQQALTSRRDFELVQAYLGLFLKIHGDLVSGNSGLEKELRVLQHQTKDVWYGLQESVDRSLCVLNFLNNAAL